MENLNEKATAIAGGLMAAVLHALGGLLFWGAPNQMMAVTKMMMYNMAYANQFEVSSTNLLGGIIGGFIIGAIVGYMFALIYNWAAKK